MSFSLNIHASFKYIVKQIYVTSHCA